MKPSGTREVPGALEQPERTSPGIARAGVLLLVGLLLVVVPRQFPWAVESVYSMGVYPFIASALSVLFDWLPFGVSEVLLGVVTVWLGAKGILVTRAHFAGQESLRTMARKLGVGFLELGAWLLIAFQLLWGLNHGRLPLAHHMSLVVGDQDLFRLEATARLQASRAAVSRAELGAPGLEACDLRLEDDGGRARLTAAWSGASARVEALAGGPVQVRYPISSRVLTLMGLTGVFSPFTGEAHVNGELPATSVPFVACHELAHQRGFAREDEANFLGWWVCRHSADPGLRYSGDLAALGMLLSALHDQDPEAARRVIQALGPDVRSDLVAEREFWRVSRSSAIARGLGEMAERGNDLYLRGQGQEGGVASYGRAVDLLLAALAREVSIKGSDR